MMMVIGFVVIAVAATLGRALATAEQPVGEVPWRTLAVNVTGAFALGVVVMSSWWDNPVIAAVAGLGSFTTFSTVIGETNSLMDNGRKRHAIAYVGLTVLAGIAAAWLGLIIGESL